LPPFFSGDKASSAKRGTNIGMASKATQVLSCSMANRAGNTCCFLWFASTRSCLLYRWNKFANQAAGVIHAKRARGVRNKELTRELDLVCKSKKRKRRGEDVTSLVPLNHRQHTQRTQINVPMQGPAHLNRAPVLIQQFLDSQSIWFSCLFRHLRLL